MIMGNVKLKSAAIFLLLLAFLLSARAASAATIGVPTNYLSMNTGLVGWWTMDGKDTVWTSATAATTLDKSGQGNTGTLTNMAQATSPTIGKIGQGLQFDGVNDYVDISGGAATSLNLNNDYTVALWVYLDASPSNHGLLRITKSSSNSAVHDKYGLNLQSLANLRFRTSDGKTPDDDPFTVNLTLGKWAHIVCSLNSSDVKECYKDGVSVGTATNDVDTSLLSPTIGYIGTLKGGAVLSNLLNGRLDDVRIYNRALSASEVSELYSLGGQGGTTDPD